MSYRKRNCPVGKTYQDHAEQVGHRHVELQGPEERLLACAREEGGTPGSRQQARSEKTLYLTKRCFEVLALATRETTSQAAHAVVQREAITAAAVVNVDVTTQEWRIGIARAGQDPDALSQFVQFHFAWPQILRVRSLVCARPTCVPRRLS